MVAIVGQAEKNKGMARAFMKRKTDGAMVMCADLLFKGQLFTAEVPILEGEGNVPALAAALEEVRRKARATQLTDLHTMERIR